MSEDEEPETIGEFLDEHYRKFAIVGIFGSVSLFVNKAPGFTQSNRQTALFGSLSIFLLVSIVIGAQSLDQIFRNRENHNLETSIGFVILLLGIVFLAFPVSGVVFSFTEIWRPVATGLVIITGVLAWENSYPSSYYRSFGDDIPAFGTVLSATFVLLLSERRWMVETFVGLYHPILEAAFSVIFWAALTFVISEILVGLSRFNEKYDEFGCLGLIPESSSQLITVSSSFLFIPVLLLGPIPSGFNIFQGFLPNTETWAQQLYIQWFTYVIIAGPLVSSQNEKTADKTHWLAILLLFATLGVSVYDIGLLLSGWLL